jgi:uncharacterized protein (TIGR02271 family)
MIDSNVIEKLEGVKVVDQAGNKIGTTKQVYVSETDGSTPLFVTVTTGLFGSNENFIPLDAANFDGDVLHVAYDKDTVSGSPNVEADAKISDAEQDNIYQYYSGRQGNDLDATPTTDALDSGSSAGTDDAMTRSEERLHVGTEKVESGKVRLRKYIVTEQQSVTVPVSHEEVRLEREPITDANLGDAMAGPDLSEEEHEIVLTEERPVVQKETVPVERVRLDTDTVTEQRNITEDVKSERIDAEGDGAGNANLS